MTGASLRLGMSPLFLYLLFVVMDCMKLKRLISCVVLLCAAAVQTAHAEEMPFQATLYGGIYLNNEQAWLLEPSVSWSFHKYFGVGLGMEITSQYYQPVRTTVINGQEAELVDSERDVAWVIFKPSAVFRTPDIVRSADGFYRLWFQAEPGVSLACPARNSLTYEIKGLQGNVMHTYSYHKFPNKGLRWFYWNVRASVNLAIDRVVIGAGYCFSDLDYYSCRRNVTLSTGVKFHVPDKEYSHSVFLSVGYVF